MSVVLAVIASYSRCFVRMLPVNWLLTSSSVSVSANISSKSVAVIVSVCSAVRPTMFFGRLLLKCVA